MTPKPNSALILVGHGSTLNPDSSAPIHLHADAIRAQGCFGEVLCCFWKEEPSLREVLLMTDARDIYVVPVFISEGYFTHKVIPRELELDGPITHRDNRTIRYCQPLGNHPRMTDALLQRAHEVAPGIPEHQTSLLIVGHGTDLNDNSAKAAKEQVRLIREGSNYAAVINTYMEEPPLISDWLTLTTTPNVVVVPFFIADGLHSYQDIPVMLGMESEPTAAASQREVFRENPRHLSGREIYYSSAIGTEPFIAEVILDSVVAFDKAHPRT